MSISWSLGTFKDRADEKQQLDRYFKMLSMQAEINAKQRDIENQAITRSDLRLDPVFTEKSSVDRMKDGSLQRELAYNRLKTIFSTTDTDSLLASLIAKDEVLLFNTYADKFFDEYRINDNISTSLFQTNWNLFLKKLSSAENIGNTLSDIKDILEGNRADTNQLLQDISASSLSTNEKLEAIREVAQESFVNGAKLNDIIKDLKASGMSAADVQRIVANLSKEENKLVDFQDRQNVEIEKNEAIKYGKELDALGVDGLIDAFKYFLDDNGFNRGRTSVITANGVQRSYPTFKLLQEPINLNYLKSAMLLVKHPYIFDSQLSTLPIDEIVSLASYRGSTKRGDVKVDKKPVTPIRSAPMQQYKEAADFYFKELNKLKLEELKAMYDAEFGQKDWIPTFSHEGKMISKRKDFLDLNDRNNLINALVLKQFPKFNEKDLSRPPQAPEQETESAYFLNVIDKDEKELNDQFYQTFKKERYIPVLFKEDDGSVRKIFVEKPEKAEEFNNEYVEDIRPMEKAVALLMNRYKNLTAEELSRIIFDPQNIRFDQTRSSPARSQFARSLQSTPASRRSMRTPQTTPRTGAPTEELRQRVYEQLGGKPPEELRRDLTEEFGQSELKEEPRWQFRQPTDKKQMENDTRGARDYIAGLWNMKGRGDQALKTYVTRNFNGVFANVPEDKNIMVWSNRDKNAVGNQKGIIKKYYKKIEALTLNRFPNADLTGISIPFEKSADHPYGLGLPKVQVPKHKAAGRYLVHIPSLQRGYLYIQYPSGWRIAHFKKQAISSDMQTMIWNMIDDKQFDSKLYKKLKADEKKLYDEVVHMIRVPVNEIKGLGMHKKLTDTERDHCIKRLKILTGEVMAGSNSKKTIKELKILVLQMLDKGYISRADFNKIIHQIMIVEE